MKQKEALPHGQWEQWVRRNCEFNTQTAHKYMSVAGVNLSRVRDLSLRGALEEVAEEKAEKEAFSD